MRELVTAIGLVLVIEGLLYAVAPGRLKALAEFAFTYADQNERDYEAFVDAIKSGRIDAAEG